MAVLIQPLIQAQAAGGGLSRTAEGEMLISATWGLGSALAQGEVVPDRIALDRSGRVLSIDPGQKPQRDQCAARPRVSVRARSPKSSLARRASASSKPRRSAPCSSRRSASAAARSRSSGRWTNVAQSFCRRDRCVSSPLLRPIRSGFEHPGLRGHPAGIGWGAGRSVVVRCECELARVGPGDILVTQVAGPALSQVLSRVAGVVTELGGSTSHLASLARERGIPMVLGRPRRHDKGYPTARRSPSTGSRASCGG